MGHFSPSRNECDYAACYCEENVWRICERIPIAARPNFFVVFISNHSKQVPLFRQRAGGTDRDWVIWDYHVILVCREDASSVSWVFDLDSTLDFPTRFDVYFREALPHQGLPEKYQRSFRVIPCSAYLETLSTDRRHMHSQSGDWLAVPPPWPAPYKAELGHNLERFILMSQEEEDRMPIAGSQVFNQRGFGRCFGFVDE